MPDPKRKLFCLCCLRRSDHTTCHAAPGIAGWVGSVIIYTSMQNQCRAIGIGEGVITDFQGDVRDDGFDGDGATIGDNNIWQVPGVRAFRAQQTMLPTGWIEVPTCRSEFRPFTLANGMALKSVGARSSLGEVEPNQYAVGKLQQFCCSDFFVVCAVECDRLRIGPQVFLVLGMSG